VRDAPPTRVSAGHGFGKEHRRERQVGENREGPSKIDEFTVWGHARLEHTAAPGGLSVGDTGSRKRRRKEERERVRDEWEGVTARDEDTRGRKSGGGASL
jgi:hypothetical protein